jgi:hypothetical protein
MYISFVIVGIRYGTGRHHADLSEHDILIAIKVCIQLSEPVDNLMLTIVVLVFLRMGICHDDDHLEDRNWQ